MKKRSPKESIPLDKSSIETNVKISMTSEEKAPTTYVPNNDSINFLVLLVLYCLQGIPMGLSSSIPLILKERNVSYESLSLFSLVSIPFSLKLLWAPFVDSLYFKSFGRRKSWLIPIQLITAVAMIIGSTMISGWLGDTKDGSQGSLNVTNLTIYFVSLYFLMATQDIAVDGWALTMLSRENVGLASICNSVGQTIGVFLANQGFIALSDAKWCHQYLGMKEGTTLIDLAGFMHFWAYVFVVTTLFVWIFKTEEPVRDDEEQPPDFTTTCKHIVTIFRLPPVRTLTVMLLTLKIAFAAADAAFGFKLQEYGMPKSDIATMSPILLGVGLVLPSVLSNVVSTRPLDVLLIGVPLKILTSASLWFILQVTKTAYADGATPGLSYFALLIALLVLHEVAGCLLFSSLMAYYSKISDPTIGGSYMTLLNTLTNLGSKWPTSLCLWILPKLTTTSCLMQTSTGIFETINISCVSAGQACVEYGGECSVTRDGYSLITLACFVFGIVWYLYYFKAGVRKLQVTPFNDWLISSVATPSGSTKSTSEGTMKSS